MARSHVSGFTGSPSCSLTMTSAHNLTVNTSLTSDAEDDDGVTSLMMACQEEQLGLVKKLIRRHAAVSMVDRCGRTALHYCATNKSTKCSAALLNADMSVVNVQDNSGYSAIQLAVMTGNVKLATFLLKLGADVRIQDYEEHSLMHWAAVCGQVELIDMLVLRGAYVSNTDSHGASPLHYAAQMCGAAKDDDGQYHTTSLRVLERLVANGAVIDCIDQDNRTPLFWAASAGSSEACDMLVKAGANVLIQDKDGLTALHCAATRGHAACVEMLVHRCPVDVTDYSGCTPLFYSVSMGHVNSTRTLLVLSSEPNHLDDHGRSAAHCAASKGSVECLRLLRSRGCDLWKANARGDYPIHEAALAHQNDAVRYLLTIKGEDGGGIDATGADGRTCLHIAAMTNNLPLVTFLIDNDADKLATMECEGRKLTAYDAAMIKDHVECAKFLQHCGVPSAQVEESANSDDEEPAEDFIASLPPITTVLHTIIEAENSSDEGDDTLIGGISDGESPNRDSGDGTGKNLDAGKFFEGNMDDGVSFRSNKSDGDDVIVPCDGKIADDDIVQPIDEDLDGRFFNPDDKDINGDFINPVDTYLHDDIFASPVAGNNEDGDGLDDTGGKDDTDGKDDADGKDNTGSKDNTGGEDVTNVVDQNLTETKLYGSVQNDAERTAVDILKLPAAIPLEVEDSVANPSANFALDVVCKQVLLTRETQTETEYTEEMFKFFNVGRCDSAVQTRLALVSNKATQTDDDDDEMDEDRTRAGRIDNISRNGHGELEKCGKLFTSRCEVEPTCASSAKETNDGYKEFSDQDDHLHGLEVSASNPASSVLSFSEMDQDGSFHASEKCISKRVEDKGGSRELSSRCTSCGRMADDNDASILAQKEHVDKNAEPKPAMVSCSVQTDLTAFAQTETDSDSEENNKDNVDMESTQEAVENHSKEAVEAERGTNGRDSTNQANKVTEKVSHESQTTDELARNANATKKAKSKQTINATRKNKFLESLEDGRRNKRSILYDIWRQNGDADDDCAFLDGVEAENVIDESPVNGGLRHVTWDTVLEKVAFLQMETDGKLPKHRPKSIAGDNERTHHHHGMGRQRSNSLSGTREIPTRWKKLHSQMGKWETENLKYWAFVRRLRREMELIGRLMRSARAKQADRYRLYLLRKKLKHVAALLRPPFQTGEDAERRTSRTAPTDMILYLPHGKNLIQEYVRIFETRRLVTIALQKTKQLEIRMKWKVPAVERMYVRKLVEDFNREAREESRANVADYHGILEFRRFLMDELLRLSLEEKYLKKVEKFLHLLPADQLDSSVTDYYRVESFTQNLPSSNTGSGFLRDHSGDRSSGSGSEVRLENRGRRGDPEGQEQQRCASGDSNVSAAEKRRPSESSLSNKPSVPPSVIKLVPVPRPYGGVTLPRLALAQRDSKSKEILPNTVPKVSDRRSPLSPFHSQPEVGIGNLLPPIVGCHRQPAYSNMLSCNRDSGNSGSIALLKKIFDGHSNIIIATAAAKICPSPDPRPKRYTPLHLPLLTSASQK